MILVAVPLTFGTQKVFRQSLIKFTTASLTQASSVESFLIPFSSLSKDVTLPASPKLLNTTN